MVLTEGQRSSIEQAYLNRDTRAFQLAMSEFPNLLEVLDLAEQILLQQPDDIRAWWLEEDCDLPHDGSDVIELAGELARRRAAS